MVPLAVVSPHLDDAVLSCGRRLAQHRGTVVITVFGGGRPDWTTVTPWDRRSGFTGGVDVIAARRREDARALAILGATPHWLDYPEAAYRDAVPDLDEIAAAIRAVGADRLLIPEGIQHPDHLIAHQVGTMTGTPYTTYTDLPYGLDAVGHAPLNWSALQKARAVLAYRSQCRAIGWRTIVRSVRAAERYSD